MYLSEDQDVRRYYNAVKKMAPRAHGVIYLLTNLDNGKSYVGQTVAASPLSRYFRHIKEAMRGSQQPLYRAIRKYGEGAFRFETIANCDDQEALNAAEGYFIDFYQTLSPLGYNLKHGGAKGKFTDDLKNRLSDIHNSPETSKRHSDAITKCWTDPNHRQKIQNYWDIKIPEMAAAKIIRDEEREKERLRTRPSKIAKRNAAIKLAHADPKVREKVGAGTRGGKWIYCGNKARRLKPGERKPFGWQYGRGKTHGR